MFWLANLKKNKKWANIKKGFQYSDFLHILRTNYVACESAVYNPWKQGSSENQAMVQICKDLPLKKNKIKKSSVVRNL